MFFEVLNDSTTVRNHDYSTHLSEKPLEESLISMRLKMISDLEPCRLGRIAFDHTPQLEQVRTASIFPYGSGIIKRGSELVFADRPWRINLMKKGIPAAVEYILLSQFSRETKVLDDDEVSAHRRKQTESYGLCDGMMLELYLSGLSRSLSSPYFRIVKFPPWINNPEILQLGEK